MNNLGTILDMLKDNGVINFLTRSVSSDNHHHFNKGDYKRRQHGVPLLRHVENHVSMACRGHGPLLN
jgi:hypothetical protein